ncbi:Zn(II)2Cys6 transcription factor [Phanerochaete sordida]|uniref:Zn(II)2Cys6 transcription factor n=1 Tax=Phanerochaete sordida TaxID=48140 RepID=A0A9P3G664_9APHY|nr:Zn(II)2Cys6 transcription factor [Phanerochaete sordida]
MSAPPFDMNAVWNDQQVPPQLEEYDTLDQHAYPLSHGGMSDPSAHRQMASSGGFPPFDPSYTQDFNFTVQPPQQPTMNASHGAQSYFQPTGPSRAAQQQTQFPGQQHQPFAGPSSIHASPNIGFAPDGSMFGQSYGSPPHTQGPYDPSDAYSSPPQQYTASFSPYPPGINTNLPGEPVMKRQRPSEFDEPGLEEKEGGQGKADAANKRPACTRCKGLKVRCEPSLEDPETCKRCYRSGGECTIPGRKKRQPPPKRELLLTQIREQAEKIKTLMSQLEEANRRVKLAQAASASNAPSPSSATDFSFVSMSDSRLMSPELDDGTVGTLRSTADMQDWIAKARESIQAFDGYINMGGSGVERGDLVADEEGSDHELEAHEDSDEYALTVEDADEDAEERASSVRRLSNNSDARPRKERLVATIPSPAVPFGLMANLSLKNTSPGLRRMKSKSSVGADDDEDEDVGLANPDFFLPKGSAPEKAPAEQDVPHILRSGLITIDEAKQLIQIYWDYMNLSVSLLDPAIYTMEYLVVHSPFLFTVICGIASRFHTEKPGLYQKAMHFARLAAGTALIGGQKSVDVVHAYILLALYPVPSRKWEDDRSWIYLGVAIRIAMDLNLHHPVTAKPRNEMHARVLLNRTRAWLNCFNLDRSTGSQYGKGPIISNTDYVANRSGEWWNSSEYNMPGFDIHLACYNADLTIMGRFRNQINSDPDSPTGFNKNLDIADLASRTDDELAATWATWTVHIREHTDPDDRQCKFRTGLLRLAYSYARTTVLSWGFQYAFGKSNLGRDVDLLNRCLRAAMDVLASIFDEIGVEDQKIFLRHGPEAQSVFVTFASAFLIKLLQPRYSSYLDSTQRQQIRERVQQVIDLLGSPEVAIDEQHSPKLYSRFLKGLLDKAAARLDRSPAAARKPLKAKSESPMVPKVELHGSALAARPSSSTPSSARPSLSPEPETSPSALLENYVPFSQEPDVLAMDVSSPFFAPPLPFNELLPSMADSAIMGVPGFAWMGSQQNDYQLGFFNVSTS